MLVCIECSKLGSATQVAMSTKPKASTIIKKVHVAGEELELVDDFAKQIKRTREELHLSHIELGRRIGEKVSFLQKIETGKMVPNQTLARKLEHMLRIRLLAPTVERKGSAVTHLSSMKPAFKDIVRIKRRGKTGEANSGRKP